MTLTASPADLTYPTTNTQLFGRVALTNPDGTSDTDYSSLTVSFQSGGTTIVTLPVGSDGTVLDPASFTPSASGPVDAAVIGTSTVEGSVSAPVALTVTNVTPSLSLKTNTVTETYGKAATVTGTLSYTSGSTTAPVTNQKVWVNTTESATGALATATTNGTGGFTITLPQRPAARST